MENDVKIWNTVSSKCEYFGPTAFKIIFTTKSPLQGREGYREFTSYRKKFP